MVVTVERRHCYGALKLLDIKQQLPINKGLGTNVEDTDALSGVSGTILNPNTEMMYQSSTMRGFDLRFKMQARSEVRAKDQTILHNI